MAKLTDGYYVYDVFDVTENRVVFSGDVNSTADFLNLSKQTIFGYVDDGLTHKNYRITKRAERKEVAIVFNDKVYRGTIQEICDATNLSRNAVRGRSYSYERMSEEPKVMMYKVYDDDEVIYIGGYERILEKFGINRQTLDALIRTQGTLNGYSFNKYLTSDTRCLDFTKEVRSQITDRIIYIKKHCALPPLYRTVVNSNVNIDILKKELGNEYTFIPRFDKRKKVDYYLVQWSPACAK